MIPCLALLLPYGSPRALFASLSYFYCNTPFQLVKTVIFHVPPAWMVLIYKSSQRSFFNEWTRSAACSWTPGTPTTLLATRVSRYRRRSYSTQNYHFATCTYHDSINTEFHRRLNPTIRHPSDQLPRVAHQVQQALYRHLRLCRHHRLPFAHHWENSLLNTTDCSVNTQVQKKHTAQKRRVRR